MKRMRDLASLILATTASRPPPRGEKKTRTVAWPILIGLTGSTDGRIETPNCLCTNMRVNSSP
ncbi:hypothetical protein D3C78_1558090 [compost metagenome]